MVKTQTCSKDKIKDMTFVPIDITSERMKYLKGLGPSKDVIHSKFIQLHERKGSGKNVTLRGAEYI